MARRHERTVARQSALQVLYTSEIQGVPASDLVENGSVLEDETPLSDYAVRLIDGVDEKMLSINARLASTSENWKLDRMPVVDRCILRLAAYEMLYVDEVPVSVAINEAVELAKGFGGEDESPRFVNGVLGRIARQIEEDAKDPEAAKRREDEMYAAYAFPTTEEEPAEDAAEDSSEPAEDVAEDSSEPADSAQDGASEGALSQGAGVVFEGTFDDDEEAAAETGAVEDFASKEQVNAER